jgi:mannosylglycerate hydrolase
MTTTVHLVPHTHWDREWYLPFQRFRLRLVDLMDSLLDILEADADFRFTMDGQLAAVEDYLQVRPEHTDRVRALAAEGRLTLGPWLVLLDEFLCSGETIIRNLETGTRLSAELGPVMDVGYLPDMFGHIAQMPQILARAGLRDAALWRGVPAAITTSAFTWAAPDGSTVRTEYLLDGYGQGLELLTIPDRVVERVAAYVEERRGFSGDQHVLAMFGGDHVMPRRETTSLAAEATAAQDRFALRVATLAEYIATVRDGDGDLPTWTGEMRSGARANILMGVASLRVNLRRAAARAERALERYAEPLHALHGEAWPQRLLDLAWRNTIVNSAHDSICGCSLDAVDEQVRVRYAEAEQIATGLAGNVMAKVASGLPRGRSLVFNPSPHDRTALVELDHVVPTDWSDVAVETEDGTRVPAQGAVGAAPVLSDELRTGVDAAAPFDLMHGRELLGQLLNGYAFSKEDGQGCLTLEVDHEPDAALIDIVEMRAKIERRLAEEPARTWRVRVVGQPRRSLTAAVPVPALSFAVVRPVEAAVRADAPVVADRTRLDNGLVAVTVEDGGTLRLTGGGVELTGVGRLVDGGEAGDSYNYGPPAADVLVDTPSAVDVRLVDSGAVRGALEVARTYEWPAGLDENAGARTSETVPCTVTTRVEVRVGEPFARLRVSLFNPATDHRLRFHIPLPAPVDRSFAEGQFAVVSRGLSAEGGHGETSLPTFPARGFVAVDGVAALLEHITEYEVVCGGAELALTVLRSTGMISRNHNPHRAEPAGPQIPIPGAQLLGPCHLAFALMPLPGSWEDGGVVAAAEAYQHGFLVERGTGARDLGGIPAAPAGPGVALHGDGVVLSALRRRDGGWLEARVVAERSTPVRARLSGAIAEAREADLLGRPGSPVPVADGGVDLDLGPWEIRTVQLRR